VGSKLVSGKLRPGEHVNFPRFTGDLDRVFRLRLDRFHQGRDCSSLVALAAAGRSPTDITIPTLTGSEGSSGSGSSHKAEPLVGGSGGASGSHEENEESWFSRLWNAPGRFFAQMDAWLFGPNTGFQTPGTVPDSTCAVKGAENEQVFRRGLLVLAEGIH
jgi:hypothetical protein